MVVPPSLKPGNKIGIVTPSGKLKEGVLDAAGELFSSWGLTVVTGRHVYSRFNQFGGSDRERASDLQQMLDDPEIRAIVCSRGGYGTVRIIDMIDFSRFLSYPKWIVGYSDITVLHSHIGSNFSIETLHAPMPTDLSREKNPPVSDKSMELLKEALFGTLPAYYLPNHPLCRGGRAEGIITGGNLSVLYSLLGSDSEIDTSGRILFLEDVGEYLYHIDRMMMAFRRSGILENIAALVVGGLTDMKDNKVPFGKSAEEIIAEAVAGYDYPVLFGFPAGHQPENNPLVLGRNVAVSVGEGISSLVFGI